MKDFKKLSYDQFNRFCAANDCDYRVSSDTLDAMREQSGLVGDHRFWNLDLETYIPKFWEGDQDHIFAACVEYGIVEQLKIPAKANNQRKKRSKEARLAKLAQIFEQ